jgi:hypothetical protein
MAKKAAVKLTALEQQVYDLMVSNAAAVAGGDFGIMEELDCWHLHITRQQLGGVVTQLVKKRLVEVHEPVETNGGPRFGGELYTQFTINEQR